METPHGTTLRVQTEEHDGAVVLRLHGDLDVYTSPLLRQHVQRHLGNTPLLIVVLSELNYIDCTGLGVLIGGLKRMRERGGDLRLVNVSDLHQRILEITGLTKAFRVERFVEQALGAAS